MSEAESDLHTFLNGLIGQTVEAVDNPLGGIIRLDIGQMASPEEGSTEQPHGWRHLTVQCPWRLESRTQVLCDWNPTGDQGQSATTCLESLVGSSVTAIRATPPAWDLRMSFSSGLELVVFSDYDENGEDAWFILGNDGAEVAATQVRGARGGIVIKYNE